jgi:hypothetical protein
MKLRFVLALGFLVLAVRPQSPGSDRFGGWLQLTGEKTGFFHT